MAEHELDKFIKIRGLILAQLKAIKTIAFQCARNNLAYECDTMPKASKQRGHQDSRQSSCGYINYAYDIIQQLKQQDSQ